MSCWLVSLILQTSLAKTVNSCLDKHTHRNNTLYIYIYINLMIIQMFVTLTFYENIALKTNKIDTVMRKFNYL